MEKFMRVALLEAHKAYKEDEVPVGACIVLDGKIIAKAHNKKEQLNDVSAHAEILAMKKACKKLKTWHLENATMFVTLEPCIMCAGAIIESRLNKIVFGAFDAKNGAIGSLADVVKLKNSKIKIEGGYLEEECSLLIKNYFKSKRRA